MKKKFTYFIGVDISKLTLDVSLMVEGKVLCYHRIDNTKRAIKSFVSLLKKKHYLVLSDTIFCMEFTGVYGNRLIDYLASQDVAMWLESGTHMKRSLGMVRGKSDKLDSKRIANFAFTNQHKIKSYTPPREVLKQLKMLVGERRRYMKCKHKITSAIKEQKQFLDSKIIQQSKRRSTTLVKHLTQQVKDIEKQIKQLIQEDSELNRIYKIVSSVDGVGMVTAMEVIITSEEFIKIDDPKKYGCYSGVVPFQYSSGTSVRGRNRVSNMANKTVKTALHMAALSAIKMKGDLRDYYLRKVDEGKNKMSIINAVRNKIILRIFACIRENRTFEKKHDYSLVNP